MLIDRAFTLKTLLELIRIDSRNPGLEAHAPGEWEIAHYVKELLDRLHWETAFHDLGEGRANVIATRKGTKEGPSLMINVHLDTVGTDGMKNPFSAEFKEGRIFGRGAQDTKGGMAAVLGMAKLLSEQDIQLLGDLVLAFVADEEHLSIGTTDLLKHVKTDAALVIEPTDLDVCIGHRGFGVFQLKTRGRTAHGGNSEWGIDANLHMGHLLMELDLLKKKWQEDHHHKLLGVPGLHIPLLSGGRQLFSYADECTAHIECRTVPGQSHTGVLHDLQGILDSLRERMDNFTGSVRPDIWRSPYEIEVDRPVVQSLVAATAEVRGMTPKLITHPWWEDAALLGEAGIEAVVMGPVGSGLHTDEEWVDARSVIMMAEILLKTVQNFCNNKKAEEYGKK